MLLIKYELMGQVMVREISCGSRGVGFPPVVTAILSENQTLNYFRQ